MADYTIPTTPLKRLRYYNNQFLTEKDFIDDQAAHLAHERAQLRALCAPGVWEGLVVSYAAVPTTSAPTVGVGIAVDVQGRLIVLDPQAAGPAPATLANGNYLLSIQYSEIATDLSINTGGSAGTADNTRFTSQPVLSATVASAVPAGAVVLGSFSVTGGQITAHSDARRQYAGLRLPGPVLAGNPPAATLTNRNDGSADGAQLTGTLTVQKTSASAIGPSLTLANPNSGSGGANAGGAIDFNSYDPGPNAPGARIQSLGDANFSSHLSISTKTPGAIGNPLVERLKITSSGVAQFSGAVTAPSLTVPTLSVQKISATTIGPSLTLNNPNAAPGGASAGGAIDFNSYDPGATAPTARIQSLGDANFSSDLSISTKAPGAIGNALVERLRITSSGAATFSGAVSAPSLTVPTFNGPVQFSGAVSAPSLTVPTFNGPVQFSGAVTVGNQLLTASAGLSVTGALSVSGPATTGVLTVNGNATITNGAIVPKVGNAATAGIQFPANPGGGAGDEAFFRYYAVTGEACKLMIGINNDIDDTIGLWQAGVERMTVTSNGVKINGAINAANSEIYFSNTEHIHTGVGDASGNAAIENAKDFDALMILGRAGTDMGRKVRLWDYLKVEGTLANLSDATTKKDISSLEYGLAEIKKLRPISFNWIDRPNPHKSLGLVGQEVREILQEVIYDDDGQISISYLGLVPVLINAIKELDNKIEILFAAEQDV